MNTPVLSEKEQAAIEQQFKDIQAKRELLFSQATQELLKGTDSPWRTPEQSFDPKSRLATDKDFFQVVTDSLAEINHPLADCWDKELSRQGSLLRQARNYPPEGQIYFINRYWRNYFQDKLAGYDTRLQRKALMDNYPTFTDWINLFKLAVVPYIPVDQNHAQEPKES